MLTSNTHSYTTRPTTLEIEFGRVLLPIMEYLGPAWFRRWLVNLIPHEGAQKMKHIVDTMYDRSKEIYEEKKALIESGDDAVLHQVGEGRDVMSILREFHQSYYYIYEGLTPR